ncbi:MAG TPA: hypothetical protein VJ927_01280 [Actinomycetota bacterium]|nr:hypothetical protein [Actinomycetota bacterium]
MKWLRLCAVAVLIGSACVASPKGDPLEDVSRNLQRLRSGILELRVISREGPADPVIGGFELSGSFQATDEGQLPVADLRYRNLTPPNEEGRLVSTGGAAFVLRRGRAYELPDRETRWLRLTAGDPLFEDVQLERWVEDPASEAGEGLDGAAIERATGAVDVVQVVHDLSSLSVRFGRPGLMEPLEGPDARKVESGVAEAVVEVISGADDRLLRRLLLEVELVEDDVSIGLMLGGLAGRSLTFDLSISEPNLPVRVEPPADPLPFLELPPAVRRRGGWL